MLRKKIMLLDVLILIACLGCLGGLAEVTIIEKVDEGLTSLDVTGYPALEELYCDENQLTSLDVTHNPTLSTLFCGYNQLTSLDVTNNPDLLELGCYDNRLTSLNVSHNSHLEHLYCSNNRLTHLLTYHNPDLETLYCSDNQLTELTLSDNLALKELDCSNNQLSYLIPPYELRVLYCSNNQLAYLDVHNYYALVQLSCSNNQLTVLEVDQTPALTFLNCSDNQLTSLDVSHSPALQGISCSNNQLTSLDVSHNPNMRTFICDSCGRSVNTVNGQFDLSTLPGFDVTRASDWNGGTVNGTKLTFNNKRVTYTYDCGNGFTATFFLDGDPIADSPTQAPTATPTPTPSVSPEPTAEPTPTPTPVPATLSMTLYNKQGGDQSLSGPLGSLEYNDGSFTTADFEDDDEFFLQIDVKDTGGVTLKETIVLPAGLSFSATDIKNRMPVTLGQDGKRTDKQVLPVYAVCQKQSVSSIEIKATGTVESQMKLSVNRGNGVVRIGATPNISKKSLYSPVYNFDWSRLLKDGYSDDVATLAVDLSISIYKEENIKRSLHNLGFSCLEYKDGGTTHTVGRCFGLKKIAEGEKIRTIVAVIIRGTFGEKEWIGNFIVGKGDKPETFAAAAKTLHEDLMQYCKGKVDPSNAIPFACGHSRGGAVADIVGHEFNQKDKWYNFCVYTYAAPNSTVVGDKTDKNIFNYVFAHDLVAYVPAGYTKYGTTYVVGAAEGTPALVSAYFQNYTDRKYSKPNSPLMIESVFLLGKESNGYLTDHAKFFGGMMNSDAPNTMDISTAHCGEGYMSWVRGNKLSGQVSYDSMCAGLQKQINTQKALLKITPAIPSSLAMKANLALSIFLMGGGSFDRIQPCLYAVQCPVDVNLLDASGDVVASIIDHVVTDCDESRVFALADGETSYFVFPNVVNYSLRIDGTGDGTMDIDMVKVGNDFEPVDSDSFKDVPVTIDKQFMLESAETTLSESALVSDDGTIYIPEGRIYNSVDKMQRLMNRYIPNHSVTECLEIEDIAEELKEHITQTQSSSLLLFMSKGGKLEIDKGNGDIAAILHSNLNQVLDKNVYYMIAGGDVFCIIPYQSDYLPSLLGLDVAFDLGLALFDSQQRLVDVTAFTDVKISWGEEASLTNNGVYPDTLRYMELVYGDNAIIKQDRWAAVPSIALPNSIVNIAEEAFVDNELMTGRVIIPNGVKTIGRRAFAGTNIFILELPNSVTFIDESAFKDIRPKPLLIVNEGSYPYQWAINNNYEYMIAG